MACLRRFISPIRTSLSSISASTSYPSLCENPVSGRVGLLKIWPKNLEPAVPIHSPKSELISNMHQKLMQTFNLSVRKLLAGSFLGFSVASGVMYNQPNVAYAMGGHYTDMREPSGFLTDDLHTFWSLARKFQLPVVLLITVLLGWRHPITLAINVLLFLFCTKPSPLSIYMFVEQIRQNDMQQDPRLHKTKFLYAKNIQVEDYKLLCLAKVELRDSELDVIGILGSWWVIRTLRV